MQRAPSSTSPPKQFITVLRCSALGKREGWEKIRNNRSVNHGQGLQCSFLPAIAVALALAVHQVFFYI